MKARKQIYYVLSLLKFNRELYIFIPYYLFERHLSKPVTRAAKERTQPEPNEDHKFELGNRAAS